MTIEKTTFNVSIEARYADGLDGEHRAGEYLGAVVRRRTRLVDTDTGAVVATPVGCEDDEIVDAEPELLTDVFGKSFCQREKTHRDERDRRRAEKARKAMIDIPPLGMIHQMVKPD